MAAKIYGLQHTEQVPIARGIITLDRSNIVNKIRSAVILQHSIDSLSLWNDRKLETFRTIRIQVEFNLKSLKPVPL